MMPRILFMNFVRYGPAWLGRRIVQAVWYEPARRMLKVSDTLHGRSLEIVSAKKAALAQGDEALKHQVGEGKDIMSILRQYFLLALRCREALWLILLDTSIVCART